MNKLSASLSKLRTVMGPEHRLAIVAKVKANNGDAIKTVKDMLAKSKQELESIHKQTGVQLPELSKAESILDTPKTEPKQEPKSEKAAAPAERNLLAELQSLLTKRADGSEGAVPGTSKAPIGEIAKSPTAGTAATSTTPPAQTAAVTPIPGPSAGPAGNEAKPTGAEQRAAAHPDQAAGYGTQATALPTPDQPQNYGAQAGNPIPSAAVPSATPQPTPTIAASNNAAAISQTPPVAGANTSADTAGEMGAASGAPGPTGSPEQPPMTNVPTDQNGLTSQDPQFNPARTSGVYVGGKPLTASQLQNPTTNISDLKVQHLRDTNPSMPATNPVYEQALAQRSQYGSSAQEIGAVPKNQEATPTGTINPQNDTPQQIAAGQQADKVQTASQPTPEQTIQSINQRIGYTPQAPRTGISGVLDKLMGSSPHSRSQFNNTLNTLNTSQPAQTTLPIWAGTSQQQPFDAPKIAELLINPIVKQAEEQQVGHIGNSEPALQRTGISDMKPEDKSALIDFVQANPNIDDEKFHEFVQSKGLDQSEADAAVANHYNQIVAKQATVQKDFLEGFVRTCKQAQLSPEAARTVATITAHMLPEFAETLKQAWVMPTGTTDSAQGTPAPSQPKIINPQGSGDSGTASQRFMTGMAARTLKGRGKRKDGTPAPHPDDVFKGLGNRLAIQGFAAGTAGRSEPTM